MNSPASPRSLRAEAEARLAAARSKVQTDRPADELLHELQVHQIELEMQNEALRQAQEALEESRDCYVDLYEFAPVGYLTLTAADVVVDANLTATALLGVERKQLLNRRFDLFVDRADRERWQQQFVTAIKHEDKHDIELALHRGDDSVFQAHLNCLRVTTGDDPPVVRVAFGDISEKKRLADELALRNEHLEELVAHRTAELAAARDAAEAASRAKSVFLANMSHEIRTPLNGILGLAYCLRRGAVTPEQAGQLDKIDAAGKHLLGVINDILDLSKIEAGKLVLKRRDFTLAEVIHTSLAVVEDAAQRKGLDLRVDIDGAPQSLHGDPDRLSQALINYLGNALKFTAAGSITLSCRLVERTASDYLLHFEVRDTGIGIASDQRTRLFDAFEQADNSTTRTYGGTGLGLVIAQRIAHMMGGETGVVSAPGAGSTFWLTARLGKGEAEPAASVPGAGSAEIALRQDHRGRRILVAEDDAIGQEVARLLLDDVGLESDLAGNGAEAVRLAERGDYAAILMDMQMPLLDGVEATLAIRRLAKCRHIPIIALTANAFDESRERCLAAGMNDFVSKPIDPARLYATLLQWLKK